jgi:hypothetical protein
LATLHATTPSKVETSHKIKYAIGNWRMVRSAKEKQIDRTIRARRRIDWANPSRLRDLKQYSVELSFKALKAGAMPMRTGAYFPGYPSSPRPGINAILLATSI